MTAFHLDLKNNSDKSQKEPKDVIEKAQRKSEEILEEAVKDSEEILSESQKFRNELQKNLQEDIAFQAQLFGQSYQEFLPEIKKYYENGIDKHLQTFKTQLNEVMVEIKTKMKEEVASLETIMKDQMHKDLEGVQAELKNYKEGKFKEIDGQVKTVVKDLTKQIFGKTITASEHQELINKALEKAKKEGVFES